MQLKLKPATTANKNPKFFNDKHSSPKKNNEKRIRRRVKHDREAYQ
jgi:hypothetical protein